MSNIMDDDKKVSEAARFAVDVAKKLGATSADAAASVDAGLSVNVRKGEVETLEYHQGQSFSVTVFSGQRKGSASSTDISEQAIEEAVAAAMGIARHTSEDPCAGLPPEDRMATYFPELDLYHPWELKAEEAIEMAKSCEAAAFEFDPRIKNSDGAGVDTFAGTSALANSHGFVGIKRGTRHSVSCTMIAEDDNGMERDYWYTTSRVPDQLDDVTEVGRKASERTVRRLSARQLKTCQAPVIYSADLARGLIGHLIGGISGGALYRKATFLLDSLDKQIFPDFVRISEDPGVPRGFGSRAFDGEGVQTVQREIIDAGVLKGFVLSQYSANKLGLQTTGNSGGTHNLTIETGDLDLDGMVQEMGTGLLVTELMGQSLNMVTGDYSRGAAGFWVENGEIQFPVEEITVAGNLSDMYKNLRAVGNDVDRRGTVATGSWLIDNMTIAGQ